MKKIRLSLILIMTALLLSGCGKPTETPEEEKKNEAEQQTVLDTSMLKIKDNILSFTDNFKFDGLSTETSIAVVIENENKTWKCAKEKKYSADFAFNIDEEIFYSVVKSTLQNPVAEKITVTILNASKNWEYICNTDYNYKPKTERFAAFDYANKTFTPKQMTFKEESAWTASEKMKNGANISNDLDCVVKGLKGYDLPPVVWEKGWYATPVTLENIRYLKSLGFDAIRLPVSWGQHLDADNNIYASWMNRVQEVVDWCMDEDLYVIINTHHDGGPKQENGSEGTSWIRATDESYNAGKDLYVKILNQICERFKSYSEKLIFANVNEICPGDTIPQNQSESAIPDSSFRAMEKWNQLFVDTVRNSGGNNAKRNISVSSIATSYDQDSLSRIQLPVDTAKDHMLFEVHCYDPWGFCGEGDDCTISEFDKSGFDINRALVPSFNFSQTHNIPVWIGEWGIFDVTRISKIVSDEERAKYVNQFISYATKHDLTPFIWNPCYYIGYTSENDAGHYCPKFLKAIQDNIYPSEYKHVTINESILNLKKDYKWDSVTNAPSTTEYDNIGIKLDLTNNFEALPVAGNNISVSFKLESDKDIPDLRFYFVDTSSAANNYWLKLDGAYGIEGHIQNITAGTEFTLSYNTTLVTSPESNITLWIYYQKTDFDEETTLTVR